MRVAEVIRDLACQLQAFIRSIAGIHGLSPTQAQILFSLPADGISMSQLADRLGLDASTMSRIIGIMVDRKWVVQGKSSTDGRVTLVRLTDDGRDLYLSLQTDLESQIDRMMSDLSVDQQHSLEEPLEDLAWRLTKARL